MTCLVKGNPKPAITWIKNKVPISQEDLDSGRVKLESNEEDSSYSLIIEKVLSTDNGSYILKAKNTIAEVSSNSQVVVLSPPIFVKPLALGLCSTPALTSEIQYADSTITKISVNEKSQLKVECQLSGNPKPTIKWLKDDDELKTGDKFKFESRQENYGLNINY